MNNEQQQIIDEAYKNYFDEFKDEWIKQYQSWLGEFNHDGRPIPQEDFINKCKTDNEFSDKWGLKIEERELDFEYRAVLSGEFNENTIRVDQFIEIHGLRLLKQKLDEYNIPTRLITITYNNETIESYE